MRAFSLVELSIVLVILGLLTGGILAGQSLIRAAELRSVVAEFDRHLAAIYTFRDRYNALPGDMREATRFWNRHASDSWCASHSGATVTAPGTCDGDGNGVIAQAAAISQSGERLQFWRQLALAGLVEGSYSGLAGSAARDEHIAGTNCPQSRIGNNACWAALSRGVSSGSAGSQFALDYGSELGLTAGLFIAPLFRPGESWSIDTKRDDGKPARGKIISNNISSCTTAGAEAGSQNDLDADYLLASDTIGCGLMFIRLF